MKNELQHYAENYETELLAYENLPRKEFIQQHIDQNYSGWNEEEETLVGEYFDALEITRYENSDYSYFEICLGVGWPNIYLNINTRWESVEYIIGWGWETYRKNISHLYDTIVQIYNLDCY